MRSFQDAYKMLNAAAETKTGLAMEVADFRDFILAITTTGNAQFTMKIQGSIQKSRPDFSSAASPTNQWSYLQAIDLADQSVANGATGIAATGTDLNKQVEVNINGQRWICVTITAYTAGAITVFGMPFNSSNE
jgi:hypothetical protein